MIVFTQNKDPFFHNWISLEALEEQNKIPTDSR